MRPLTRLRPPARGFPLTRTTIVAQTLLAALVAGFLLTSTGVRLPFAGAPYALDVVLTDAAGLDARDRPAVTVAGVRAGAVAEVRFDARRGAAVARVELDDEVRGRLFADAAPRMTPRSALNDLVLEIDPGDPSAGPLRGAVVRGGPSAAPTGYDRVLGTFDDETRAAAQLLVGTLREVVERRPGPLRDALRTLPDLTRDATRLARRVARRRAALERLVGEIDALAAATGRRGRQLTRAVGSARRTLEAAAARRAELGRSVRRLPAVVAQVQATFGELQDLGRTADPALAALRPAVRELPDGLRELRRLLPPLRSTVRDAGGLVRSGRAPLGSLRATVRGLGAGAATLRPVPAVLRTLMDAIADTSSSIRSMVDFWPGTLSSQDALGVTTRAIFFRIVDVDPRAFGLGAGQAAAARGLRAATARLRRLRPELFRRSRGADDVALPVLAARALLVDLCRRRHDFACSLVALVDADPPEVLRR